MKKASIYFFIVIISFFLTNKIIDMKKNTDPIMQKIISNKEKYEILPVNGIIEDNTIYSGENGVEVDIDKSYKEMIKYGNYNELLTALKEVSPDISIENNYDKYLVGSNPTKKEIALVFKIEKDNDISKIIKILEDNLVTSTFFIDGKFLEKNTSLIKKHSSFEYEILSYDNSYQEDLFKTSIEYLESITKSKKHFCYSEEEKDEVLNLCKKLKIHTIKPLVINKDIYREVKNNLKNGIIISLPVNYYTEINLSKIILYIKKKGYILTNITNLLSEE